MPYSTVYTRKRTLAAQASIYNLPYSWASAPSGNFHENTPTRLAILYPGKGVNQCSAQPTRAPAGPASGGPGPKGEAAHVAVHTAELYHDILAPPDVVRERRSSQSNHKTRRIYAGGYFSLQYEAHCSTRCRSASTVG